MLELIFLQALLSFPIQGTVNEPPGLVYYDPDPTGLDFEIGFRVDSELLDSSKLNWYGCFEYTPWGMWLYDRHPGYGGTGRWMITLSRDGNLCFNDKPDQGSTALEFTNIPVDECLTLTATHTSGVLTVSVNGETQTRNTGNQSPQYQAGSNGIGVGREVNGYHGQWSNQSFAGDVYFLRDGNTFPLEFGNVTGGAVIGESVCESDYEPPIVEEGPCDIDPTSIDCACESNPHPACNSCQ